MKKITGKQIKNYITYLIKNGNEEIYRKKEAGEKPTIEDVIEYIKSLDDEYIEIIFMQNP